MHRLAILFVLLASTSAHAFNFVGHIAIAQAAYERLDAGLQAKLDEQARALIESAPGGSNDYTRYTGVSDFARIAIGPDTWTDSSIADLYGGYGATYIQNSLWQIKNQTTKNWHYINYNVDSANSCDFVKERNNVVWAMGRLEKAYGEYGDTVGKGLVLSSIIHYVADAHQPLHTAARDLDPSSRCKSDYGGNSGNCLEKKWNGKCAVNLHKYWDRNANRWNDRSRLGDYVAALNAKIDTLDAEPSIAIEDWIEESRSHADFAYTAPLDSMPGDEYEEKAHAILTERMALAAIRLARLLETLETESDDGLEGADHQ